LLRAANAATRNGLTPYGCAPQGRNEDGQLGLGDETNRYRPTPIPGLPDPVAGGACGGSHSLLMTVAGELFGAGKNDKGQLGIGRVTADPVRSFAACKGNLVGKKVTGVASGRDFAIACTADGDVYSWGCVLEKKSLLFHFEN